VKRPDNRTHQPDIGVWIAKYGPDLIAEARVDCAKNPPTQERVGRMMNRFGRRWHEVEIAILVDLVHHGTGRRWYSTMHPIYTTALAVSCWFLVAWLYFK
jgi:hypothetical protein